jgi:hypothetical protein
MQDQSLAAQKLRARALPVLAAEPHRRLDHSFSGPDLPCGESVRNRFFCED